MSLSSLKELYVEELKDLYNAENQLLKALPAMSDAATEPKLKAAFKEHLQQTEGHVQRLTTIFETLGESPRGKVCKAMKGLVAEGEEVIEEDGNPAVKDAALIAAGQRVEHYEMAGYGSAKTFATLLGEKDAVNLLQQTLDEEGQTDEKLTALATSTVNPHAKKVHAKA
jgi:ferritin-like metal-binding protein YciE